MGLIQCPDCGKDISERAVTCIYCGSPIREWQTEKRIAEEAAEAARKEAEKVSYEPETPSVPSVVEAPAEEPEKKAGSFTRRNKILAIAAILIVAGVGIFFAVRALIRPDYYQEGLKVTKQMGEMLESEDYALMLGMGASELEYINAANTGDYDSPTAVYAIRLNHEKWEKKLIDSLSPEQKEHWNRLPDWMRQQLMSQQNAAVIITGIIGRSVTGSAELIFYNQYRIMKKVDRLKGDPDLLYLYVFKDGMPVAVSFNDGYITGVFLITKDISLGSLQDVRNLFGEYECTVEQVKP